jgi:RNA recognition motif-containing protein
MATKLFVGNLSFNTTEGDVLELFKKSGNVTSCSLIVDKFTNKSRGFAFVEFATQEEATKAIAELGGKELDGRALTVNEAKPREEPPWRLQRWRGGKREFSAHSLSRFHERRHSPGTPFSFRWRRRARRAAGLRSESQKLVREGHFPARIGLTADGNGRTQSNENNSKVAEHRLDA